MIFRFSVQAVYILGFATRALSLFVRIGSGCFFCRGLAWWGVGGHAQQAVHILCNSSWYVLQTLVSVAGFRFAWLASGRNGAFLGFAGRASGRNGSFLGFAGRARGRKGSFLGFARAASEEKGGFFTVARCANYQRGSFLFFARCANSQRGSFFTLCKGYKRL